MNTPRTIDEVMRDMNAWAAAEGIAFDGDPWSIPPADGSILDISPTPEAEARIARLRARRLAHAESAKRATEQAPGAPDKASADNGLQTATQDERTARDAYTLQEIADWQLKRASGNVTLPDLQRGFVWKPSQTENLWDSLLRHFPVGTLILAPSREEESATFELLDGQQRATAITFGFCDPWAAVSIWRFPASEIPILWLDLASLEDAEIASPFRLLTRSQPWGYERKDNQTPLTATDRRKFLTKLVESLPAEEREKRYLDLPLTRFWPWDAKLPVPFSFLVKSFRDDDWKDRVQFLCAHHFPTLTTKRSPAGDYKQRIAKFLAKPEADELRRRICSALQSRLPVVQIQPEVLLKQTSRRAKARSDGDEDIPDDVETLFIRINSAGTQLAGEELIYSIYKSIFPDSITLVERAGHNFMLPSRLVSLATRIVQADLQRERQQKGPQHRGSKTDGIALRQKVRVKDFRELIYNGRFRFKQRLGDFIKSLDQHNIFEKARDILTGSESFQLPSALAVDIARHSPEILFVLIYRLHLGDHIDIGSVKHRKILGFLTALSWFGRGDKLRDHDPCLRHLWRDLLTADQNAFWCRSVLEKTIQPRKNQLVMVPLLPPRRLEKFINESIIEKGKAWDRLESPSGNSYIARWYKSYFKSHYESTRASEFASEACWVFLEKLERQRGLVLYAQREFVNSWFKNFRHVGVQNLEDTNCPWDWDHIHAQKLIERKRNVDTALKEWHSSIGNLRIWPMELNRADSDRAPRAKLSAPDAAENPFFRSYVLENSTDILRASFSADDFLDIDEECDVKTEVATRRIRRAILGRMLALYRHWFEELGLAHYFPE